MRREQTEVNINLNSKKDFIEIINKEIEIKSQKLNYLNDHKTQLK